MQYTGTGANTCPLATLPFLHTTTSGNVPTVAQIMDRVLVSHDWMGRNFEDLLLANQDKTDLLRLFNGVTAIVIGAHVRPSFYYALTGAIHLDADNFWLHGRRARCHRRGAGLPLGFRPRPAVLRCCGATRTARIRTSSCHFRPRRAFRATSATCCRRRAGSCITSWRTHRISCRCRCAADSNPSQFALGQHRGTVHECRSCRRTGSAAQYPLTSAQMKALAEVKFMTGPVSDTTLVNGIPYSTLRAYSPNDVAGFFAADRATDEYNYTTTREDIAMTFEEVMMVRNHGWRRDFAITDKITATSTSSTLTVRWGQRGRVGDATIKPRAQYRCRRARAVGPAGRSGRGRQSSGADCDATRRELERQPRAVGTADRPGDGAGA